MKAIEFKEQNRILAKPENMTDEECKSLPVFSNGEECISCWQLSDEEIEKLKETKCIWLGVLSGQTQPPVFLSVDYPFVMRKNNGKWKIFIIDLDDEKYWVIAENETQAINCLCVVEKLVKNTVTSIRQATIEEIQSTKIQSVDDMKMPTLMDYYLNYDGNEPQIICSTAYE